MSEVFTGLGCICIRVAGLKLSIFIYLQSYLSTGRVTATYHCIFLAFPNLC